MVRFNRTPTRRSASRRFMEASRATSCPTSPTEFQRLVSASVGTMLPIFGAKLFLQSPSTFAPVDQVPVTSNYVVGPGDQLLIRVWGQINFNAEVTVDRTGMVYLPQIGAIHVGGTSYDQLQQQVQSNVARIYKNFHLSVNLGQLHPIRIFVTGPGAPSLEPTLSVRSAPWSVQSSPPAAPRHRARCATSCCAAMASPSRISICTTCW